MFIFRNLNVVTYFLICRHLHSSIIISRRYSLPIFLTNFIHWLLTSTQIFRTLTRGVPVFCNTKYNPYMSTFLVVICHSFDIIPPEFYFNFMQWRLTSTRLFEIVRLLQTTSTNCCRSYYFVHLIGRVDVNILRLSMLVISTLLPHPNLWRNRIWSKIQCTKAILFFRFENIKINCTILFQSQQVNCS